MNQSTIAAELCEEREVPESTCAGKCHLKKELEKLELDSNSPEEAPVRIQVEEINYTALHQMLDVSHAIETSGNGLRPFYSKKLSKGFFESPVDPPEVGLLS